MGEVQRRKATIAYFEVVSGLFLFLTLLLVLFTASLGDHPIFLVLIGFFPVILTVIISLVIHDQYEKHKKILWLLPVVVVGIFYLLGRANPNLAGGMDVDILSGINFILAIIYILVVMSVFKDYKDQKGLGKITHKHTSTKKSHAPKQDLKDYIHSIEDKSKALNFAIGRVYSQFHGGKKEMRDKIRIPKEWYNEFSFIGIGTNTIDYKKLNEIVAKFEIHLRLFEKTEKEVFGKQTADLKNLIRDIPGRDTIIKVLDHNDKDPVKSYYEGAITFCEKIRGEMNQRELKLVKNTYIPKSEDEKEKIKSLTAPPKELKEKGKHFPQLEKKALNKPLVKKEAKKKPSERKPISNHP